MARSWSQQTTEHLRAAGHRQGAARAAVIEFLESHPCCVGAQEIHEALRAQGRSIGLASVYRIVDMLVDHGLLLRVDLGDGLTRFEPAQAADDHHHHLVCDGCGKVEPFADARLERVLRDVEQRSGYAVAAHDVVLRGECEDCRA